MGKKAMKYVEGFLKIGLAVALVLWFIYLAKTHWMPMMGKKTNQPTKKEVEAVQSNAQKQAQTLWFNGN